MVTSIVVEVFSNDSDGDDWCMAVEVEAKSYLEAGEVHLNSRELGKRILCSSESRASV